MRQRILIGYIFIMLAAALPVGCSKSASKDEGIFAGLMPPKPADVARDAFNVTDPDKRRRSVNLLSNAPFGGEAPYLKTYRLLVDDPDPTVRAACLRALGKHGQISDVPAILPYLKDKTSFVRWEAAKALQRLHSPDAVDPLLTTLHEDDDPDVRTAAANALGQYPEPRVFAALIGALQDEDFTVVTEVVHSLEVLTGQDYGEDGAQWLSWSQHQDKHLFAGQEAYYYPQFVRPPTIWDKIKFWKSRKVVVPTQPTGIEQANDPLVGPPAAPAASAADPAAGQSTVAK
ncbi:MAG: hypothetical protein GC162_11975 [Planctomycetes bacterium]|nr:hypothetical protein [Planctomycetota bacterium]